MQLEERRSLEHKAALMSFNKAVIFFPTGRVGL